MNVRAGIKTQFGPSRSSPSAVVLRWKPRYTSERPLSLQRDYPYSGLFPVWLGLSLHFWHDFATWKAYQGLRSLMEERWKTQLAWFLTIFLSHRGNAAKKLSECMRLHLISLSLTMPSLKIIIKNCTNSPFWVRDKGWYPYRHQFLEKQFKEGASINSKGTGRQC